MKSSAGKATICDPNPNYPCPPDRTRYTFDCGGDRLVNYWCECCTCT
jgi:hypothetical protein